MKTNFWSFVDRLFGVSLEQDQGLAGHAMPGVGNPLQTMHFDPDFNWFTGEGIPITPYDEDGVKNYYPMFEVVVRNTQGATLATTQIVLPVSDELDCKICHASGAVIAARPAGGWSFLPDPERDYKTNVVRKHDDQRLGDPTYQAALAEAGYLSGGLLASIECQSCHGSMSAVGASDRAGWFDEPGCEGCHTGAATDNNGQIRFLSVFEPGGQEREAVNDAFAVNADTLYRFSSGHGGLQCSACHASSPQTVAGGPHGMHPIGQDWLEEHEDAADDNPAQCRSCRGEDGRGTVLSRALGDRTLDTELGRLELWRGFQIGCYNCHRGPDDDDRNRNRPAVVEDASLTTVAGVAETVTLQASDRERATLTLRIVSQPANGTVALDGNRATYFPFEGFSGNDSFTFAAWDGQTDSNLGTVRVVVEP